MSASGAADCATEATTLKKSTRNQRAIPAPLQGDFRVRPQMAPMSSGPKSV
jgi:hypothetical protein